MSDESDQDNRPTAGKARSKRLWIIVFVGGALTLICLILGWWWVATVFLLATLFLVCLTFTPRLYPHVFTIYTAFAIFWLTGSLLDELLPVGEGGASYLRTVSPWLIGALLAIVIPFVSWILVLAVSTGWILNVTDSLGISWREALRCVYAQVFETAQAYLIVENGELAHENPRGILSRLGGPGILVVRTGNAVVLERGGTITRIAGPGVYMLVRLETIKRPEKVKGIVDLRPQGCSETVPDVLTRDGILLTFNVSVGYQIEPQRITDDRPASHFPGGEATTRLLDGDFPVYEATIRKAVLETGAGGWQGVAPGGTVAILRDIIGAYTLDQIFASSVSEEPNPDARMIKRIEEEVVKRFGQSRAGVWLRGFDIREIHLPENVHERMVRRWATAVERELRLQEAEVERQALITLSEGRAKSLQNVEGARLEARRAMLRLIQGALEELPPQTQQDFAISFFNVIQQLTDRIGYDESVAMRYIEAMHAIVESEGPKTFVITSPNPSPGALPAAPPPSSFSTKLKDGQKRQE